MNYFKDKYITSFFVVLLLFIIFFSFGTKLPNEHRRGFYSDESSYFSIIQSLAYDLDITYTRQDLIRIKERYPGGPVGVYLKEGKDGRITYAKPFIYPLFAAPFFRVFDVNGILLFNGLMLFFIILMGYVLLRFYFPPNKSLSTILLFIFCSVTWIYTWWVTSDLFNFFCLFAGLFFFFFPFKRKAWFYMSGLFFTLFILSKPTNLAAVGIIFLILLCRKDWRRFVVLSLICLVILSFFLMFYYQQTDELNYKLYYGGNRASFYNQFPLEKPEYKFESKVKTTADDYWKRIYITPKIAALNIFYYIFGRFTGVFIYFFPAVFFGLLFLFQAGEKRKEDWFVLAAAVVSILVACILFAADSYFGGSGSLGNRYFLNIFPFFFFLGFRTRGFKFSLVPMMVAAILLAPTFMDAVFYSYRPRMAGVGFPINLFPVEKTQYPHLPTNENPRSRDLDVDGKYRIFFINDNFHPLEDGHFWTNGRKEVELLLLAPKRVKTFVATLRNSPLKNKAYIRFEHRLKGGVLVPNEKRSVTFEGIGGTRVTGGYLYHITVKSDASYCAYFEEENSEDKRWLGINVHIDMMYE